MAACILAAGFVAGVGRVAPRRAHRAPLGEAATTQRNVDVAYRVGGGDHPPSQAGSRGAGHSYSAGRGGGAYASSAGT